ncbi:MAG TPA: SH3 domain-containing protein [Pyrinomonadaceae bacterium]|nr:SH3 domain-containing protein [Pyrinomonadaceae bacterium]
MTKKISMTFAIAFAMFLSTTVMPSSANATTSNSSAAYFQDNCVVTGTNNTPLNVRSTPNGRVIGSLKLGAHILAYGIEQDNYGDNWTKIKFKRGYGFVSTQFVSCG